MLRGLFLASRLAFLSAQHQSLRKQTMNNMYRPGPRSICGRIRGSFNVQSSSRGLTTTALKESSAALFDFCLVPGLLLGWIFRLELLRNQGVSHSTHINPQKVKLFAKGLTASKVRSPRAEAKSRVRSLSAAHWLDARPDLGWPPAARPALHPGPHPPPFVEGPLTYQRLAGNSAC